MEEQDRNNVRIILHFFTGKMQGSSLYFDSLVQN